MTPELRRLFTDIIYKSLFGKDTTGLLIYFGLSPLNLRDPNDIEIRDCFGELAIWAVGEIELRCAAALESGDRMSVEDAMQLIQFHAEEISIEAKATAAGQGIDLLTGVVLETQ